MTFVMMMNKAKALHGDDGDDGDDMKDKAEALHGDDDEW